MQRTVINQEPHRGQDKFRNCRTSRPVNDDSYAGTAAAFGASGRRAAPRVLTERGLCLLSISPVTAQESEGHEDLVRSITNPFAQADPLGGRQDMMRGGHCEEGHTPEPVPVDIEVPLQAEI